MTLNVSMRVPDGIVLASDSLTTVTQRIDQKMNVETDCKKCGDHIEIKDVAVPPMTVPSSTWPYAQKVYPLQRKFGLATHGSAYVNNRSIYNHVSELTTPEDDGNGDHLDKMANFIVEHFKTQMLLEWKKGGVDANLQPDTFYPLGFQLCGFTKDSNGEPVPRTCCLQIGKSPKISNYDSIGCTVTGDTSVVCHLWAKDQPSNVDYRLFSLQDAIDYAKFLIRTTSDYQRFSGKLPTVGGEIDIALITNHRGFRWIAQKDLYHILDQEEQL
jgi:hypothetical protein